MLVIPSLPPYYYLPEKGVVPVTQQIVVPPNMGNDMGGTYPEDPNSVRERLIR